jgi:hypothetical protein
MHQSRQSESIVRTVNAYQSSTRCIRCFVLRLRIVIDVKLDLMHRGVTNFAARLRSVHGTKLRGTTNQALASGVPLHSNGKAQLVQTVFAPRVDFVFLEVTALCSHPVAKSTVVVIIVGDPAMVVRSVELNKLLVHRVPFLYLSSCKALFLVLGVAFKLKVDGQKHLSSLVEQFSMLFPLALV